MTVGKGVCVGGDTSKDDPKVYDANGISTFSREACS